MSLDVLTWEVFPEGATLCEDRSEMLKRPYELLHHAEQRLKGCPSGLDLVDVITTLKRAAFQRRDALEKAYKLKHLPISGLPKEPLERLAFFGIIKPIVFRNLVDVRNCVEHQDAAPPGVARCKELAEYVWYFLKSTDRLLKEETNLYLLGNPNSDDPEDYWIEIGNGPSKDWNIRAHGWLPSSLFMPSPLAGGCMIEGVFRYAREQHRQGDEKRAPDDVFVDGRVVGPKEALISIYEHYFSDV